MLRLVSVSLGSRLYTTAAAAVGKQLFSSDEKTEINKLIRATHIHAKRVMIIHKTEKERTREELEELVEKQDHALCVTTAFLCRFIARYGKVPSNMSGSTAVIGESSLVPDHKVSDIDHESAAILARLRHHMTHRGESFSFGIVVHGRNLMRELAKGKQKNPAAIRAILAEVRRIRKLDGFSIGFLDCIVETFYQSDTENGTTQLNIQFDRNGKLKFL